jgi:hypothetical protein
MSSVLLDKRKEWHNTHVQHCVKVHPAIMQLLKVLPSGWLRLLRNGCLAVSVHHSLPAYH